MTSRQNLNEVKWEIFFVNTNKSTQRHIADILGFNILNLPSKYYGEPLFLGQNRTKLF